MGMFDFLDPTSLFGGGGNPTVPGMDPSRMFGGSGGGGLPGMGSGGMPSLPGMGGSGGMGGMDPFSMFGGSGGGGGMFAGLSGGGVLGALTGSEAIYGKKPALLTAPTPTDVATQAARANLAVQPLNQQLAAGGNKFAQDQLAQMLRAGIPGYESIEQTSANRIQDYLAGKVPQDVQDQIQNNAAARAIGGGYGGSALHGNLVARDLGLTSLDLQKMGLDEGQRFLAEGKQLAVPPEFSTAQFYLHPSYDPYGEYKNTLRNSVISAAPVPAAKGAAASQQALLESLLAAYSGGGKSALTDPRTYDTNWGNVDFNTGYDYSPPPSYGGGPQYTYGQPGSGGGLGGLVGLFG